jgi:hypothetical protein
MKHPARQGSPIYVPLLRQARGSRKYFFEVFTAPDAVRGSIE